MAKSSILIDLEDPRTLQVADVISNKTCKKILGLLAERELSESELAGALRVPSNTVNYNVKKLVRAGLIESSRSLWSSKGRKVQVYRIFHKNIVISPKTFTRGVLPAFFVTLVVAVALKIWSYRELAMESMKTLNVQSASESILRAAGSDGGIVAAQTAAQTSTFYALFANLSAGWAWFFLGSLVALVIVLLWNWFRN